MRQTLIIFISFLYLNLFSQEKVFHLGGAINLSSNWIVNQNNFGTLDGFNNNFARRSELGYSITLGGGIGIVGGYNFKKRHGIETAIYYNKLGQKYKDEIGQENYTTTPTSIDYIEVKRNVKLNYIQIPVLYKFELVPQNRSSSKKYNYFGAIGPQIGYLIAVFEEIEIADPDIGNNLSSVPEKDKFRNFDAGLAINNGFQIRLNKNIYINTSLNLYFGLIDINGKKIKEVEYFSKNDVKYRPSYNFNASINAGIHYIFTTKGYY